MKTPNLKWITDNKVAVSVIAIIGLLLAFYFLFWKKRGKIKGIPPPTEDLEDAKDDLEILADQGIKPTMIESTYSALADAIHNDLKFSIIDDDKKDAKRILLMMLNDADLLMLKIKFGNRQEHFFGIPNGGVKNLNAFVSGNFKNSTIASINNNYAQKGMLLRF